MDGQTSHEVSAPEWLSRGRIPGLDGLRAISIALVLAAHVLFASGHGYGPLAYGFLGVDVFFVISGFLITLLLIREQQRTGRISLAGFYRRRSLRILPAYLLFLAAIAVISHLGWERVQAGDWIAALTYTMNWRSAPAWVVGHIWSLSMEEQFYLLWPPLFLLLSPRAARRALIVCIVLAPVFRVACRHYLPTYEAFGRDSFPARVEPIAAGCLLALLAASAAERAWLNRWFMPMRSLGIAIVALLLVSFLSTRSRIVSLVCRSTLDALLIPIVVWACANARGSIASRILEWRPLVGLGILSYSLYLWQQPFLNPGKHSMPCRFPLNVLLALGAALASHFLIERPFLALKDRKPATVGAEAFAGAA